MLGASLKRSYCPAWSVLMALTMIPCSKSVRASFKQSFVARAGLSLFDLDYLCEADFLKRFFFSFSGSCFLSPSGLLSFNGVMFICLMSWKKSS